MQFTNEQRDEIRDAIQTHTTILKGNNYDDLSRCALNMIAKIQNILTIGLNNETPEGYGAEIGLQDISFQKEFEHRDKFFRDLANIICESNIRDWKRFSSGAPRNSLMAAARIEYHWKSTHFGKDKHFTFFTKIFLETPTTTLLKWHLHIAKVIDDGYETDKTDEDVSAVYSILNNLHRRLQSLELKTQNSS